jgi:hypothetical protein
MFLNIPYIGRELKAEHRITNVVIEVINNYPASSSGELDPKRLKH